MGTTCIALYSYFLNGSCGVMVAYMTVTHKVGVRISQLPQIGPEVKRLRCLVVSEFGAGSTPVGITKISCGVIR